MTEHIYGEGVYEGEIVRSNGLSVVYSMFEPVDLLEGGLAVGYDDFQDAARTLKIIKRVATLAYRETVSILGGDEEPFSFVDTCNLKVTGSGLCTTWGFVGVKLNDFYIYTQALHDHIEEVERMPASESRHTPLEFTVLKTVLDDRVE